MVQLSAGVWLHGINLITEDRHSFNPLRMIVNLGGNEEKIYTVEEFLGREELDKDW